MWRTNAVQQHNQTSRLRVSKKRC